MAEKRFNFNFTFPKAKAAHAQQHQSETANDLGTAFNRAWKDVKKRKGIKGSKGIIERGTVSFTATDPYTSDEED
jgi:hypothetical protein